MKNKQREKYKAIAQNLSDGELIAKFEESENEYYELTDKIRKFDEKGLKAPKSLKAKIKDLAKLGEAFNIELYKREIIQN